MSERVLFDVTPTPKAHLTNEAYMQLNPDYRSEVLPSTNETLKIEVDQARIDEVLGTLLEQYETKGFPYDKDSTRLPHDPRHMPEALRFGSEKYGGKEHAVFLFNSCYYMRGGIKSVEAFKLLSKVYDDRPELFVCSQAMNIDPEEIAAVLKKYKLGFQKTVSRQWVINAKSMHERYDGDPRNIFNEASTYETTLDQVKNKKVLGAQQGFYGFQEKMTSMLIYYLMDEGMIEPFNFPIPIDLHVMRVSIANKLITFPGTPPGTDLYRAETRKALRNIYFNYARDNNVNPLRLCDAVWLLSEAVCGKYPGNITYEPLGRGQRNGRSTILIPETIDLNNESQRKAYHDSCGQCALEQTCELAIPGKPYYVGGKIIVRETPKVPFPNPTPRIITQSATLF